MDSDFLFAQSAQHNRAAYRETDHGSEGSHLHQVGAEVKSIGKNRGDGAQQAEHIEPQRSAYRDAYIFSETKLHQKSSESDGGYHYDGQRTGESAAVGVDNHQHEGEKQ